MHGKIKKTLSDAEFEQYLEAQSEIECIVKFDAFNYGFRLGILLMIEVLTENKVNNENE